MLKWFTDQHQPGDKKAVVDAELFIQAREMLEQYDVKMPT